MDHILSRRAARDIPGFDDLPADVRKSLLNHPDNLQPMTLSANAAKGAKSEGFGGPGFETWNGEKVDPTYRAELLRVQNEMRQRVLDAISSYR